MYWSIMYTNYQNVKQLLLKYYKLNYNNKFALIYIL